MNRWAKAGVLDRVFTALQEQQIIRIKIEAMSVDSTIVKVHPDGTGALKKTDRRPSEIQGRVDNQDSYGCRRCSNSDNFLAVSRPNHDAPEGRISWAPWSHQSPASPW